MNSNLHPILLIFVILILILVYKYNKKQNYKNSINISEISEELPNPFEKSDEVVEPNNPFYTSKMVVLNHPNTKFENVKKDYLVKKNMEYMRLDDDELNKNLLPQGCLFVGP